MDTIKQIAMQEMNEMRFNRKHIDVKIRHAIETNEENMEKVLHGVELIEEYMGSEYYASKNERVSQLKVLDIKELVTDIFVGIAYVQRAELFTSVTAKLASRLGFNDRVAAILTVAEMLAVLCDTDAFDINKVSKQASLMVISRLYMPENLLEFIRNSEYLPPMVCEPLELTHNYSSGYLTHNDSLILGSGNHHDGDICLDVLNKMNKVALRIDTDFVSSFEEEPTFEFETPEQHQNWINFKRQSYEFYMLMVEQGNKFYLTHKNDKRGRIYASGYHITTQGTGFKKAMLELANEEIVDGVP